MSEKVLAEVALSPHAQALEYAAGSNVVGMAASGDSVQSEGPEAEVDEQVGSFRAEPASPQITSDAEAELGGSVSRSGDPQIHESDHLLRLAQDDSKVIFQAGISLSSRDYASNELVFLVQGVDWLGR
ncbi:MAG: hypothetical protein M3O70_19650 [Actinomycetota bacterium]|nr:hypothetical protein [Actinomycetota bacterium]